MRVGCSRVLFVMHNIRPAPHAARHRKIVFNSAVLTVSIGLRQQPLPAAQGMVVTWAATAALIACLALIMDALRRHIV